MREMKPIYDRIVRRASITLSGYKVVKRHKRLWIDDENGNPVYTPPDFIRLQSREPLKELAENLSSRPYIDAVMGFETAIRQARTFRQRSS